MRRNQIKHLKLLGYKDTQEDGAILEHPCLSGLDAYVWTFDKFEAVLSNYSMRLVIAERKRMANKLIS